MSEGGGSGCLAHATDSGGDDLVRLGAKESGLDWCVHKIPPTGCARSGLLTSLKQICVGRDCPLARDDFADARCGYPDGLGQSVLADAQWFEDLFLKKFTRADG